MKKPYLPASGEAWERARMSVLVRDNFTCQAHKLGLCEEPCKESRLRHLNVHHIVERQNGGDHDLDNLVTICRAHHIEIHPHMKFELYQEPRDIEPTEGQWPPFEV